MRDRQFISIRGQFRLITYDFARWNIVQISTYIISSAITTFRSLSLRVVSWSVHEQNWYSNTLFFCVIVSINILDLYSLLSNLSHGSDNTFYYTMLNVHWNSGASFIFALFMFDKKLSSVNNQPKCHFCTLGLPDGRP